MPGPWTPGGDEPLKRSAVFRTVGELATRLLARAEAQQAHGVKDRGKVSSGLGSVDELVRSWWGLTVVHGGSGSDQLTFAARVALFTARASGRVLWLCLDGYPEVPAFRLLTGMSKVPARSVFVRRDLSQPQWAALSSARNELESLPIQVADAHGLSLGEIRAAGFEATGMGALDLVIVDGIGEEDARLIGTLESLSDELDVPMLAVTGVASESEQSVRTGNPPTHSLLRKGSLLIRLERQSDLPAEPSRGDAGRLNLEVRRVEEKDVAVVALRLDARCRWIDEPG